MPEDEAQFNYKHSQTRNVLERAFALWKNVFRIFASDLLHDTPEEMASLIEATLVLHNWFIDFKLPDDVSLIPKKYPEWMHIGGDIMSECDKNLIDGEAAAKARNDLKEYLMKYT
ncbi:putative nuclease harbi1 [Aphanomyces cochlioides]|nr:putative nuclease harbi1 [Aphanomyces cochlioides]